jgi:hypothetical protein
MLVFIPCPVCEFIICSCKTPRPVQTVEKPIEPSCCSLKDTDNARTKTISN